MNKEFKDLATYVRLHDGYGKPKINFQQMYQLFPSFTFEADSEFGTYTNFGQAFEAKNLGMIITSQNGHTCHMTYREYGDSNENTAYVS